MVEVKAGDENVGEAVSRDRNWEIDHKTLATLFLDKGDVGRAAEEFEKVSSLPQQPGAAIYAAEGYGLMGDSMRSESLAHAAQLELGASKAHMSALRLRVRADILSRRGTVP